SSFSVRATLRPFHPLSFSLLLTRPPPTSTLFPYTTLFRSNSVSFFFDLLPSHAHSKTAKCDVVIPGNLFHQSSIHPQHDGRRSGINGPCGRGEMSRQRLHQSRLTRAISANHTNGFTGVYYKRQWFECFYILKRYAGSAT